MLTELAYNMFMKQWKPEDIKKVRLKFNLSQKAFGELLGVTRMHIYYIERGEKIPSKTLTLLLDCVEEKLKRKGNEK